MSARQNWTEDELRVLAAIYFKADFSLGDDERDECRTIAACFNRSAAAIDRQWRNMDAVVKGKSGMNIGKLVSDTVAGYLSNPAGFTQLAAHICEKRGWPLVDLIRQGYQSIENKPIVQEKDDKLSDMLKRFAQGMMFKVFPAGAQGFQRDGEIYFNQIRYSVQISAVAIGTRGNNSIHVQTKPTALADSLEPITSRVQSKIFGTGRRGYYVSGRATVDTQSFQVAIRAIQVS
jgi:hypothetical protein